MSLTTDVLKHVAELEAQVQEMYGWDSGVSLWNLHAHEEDFSDLMPMKMGGHESYEGHPMDLVQRLTPPPPCTVGLVMSWEAWHSPSGFTPPTEAPDRIDIRYVVAALRNGAVLLLEHKRDQKPRIGVMDPMRCLTVPGAGDICAALRDVVTTPSGPPSGLIDLIHKLLAEGGGGFMILGGPDA